jgi:hypothetical protein
MKNKYKSVENRKPKRSRQNTAQIRISKYLVNIKMFTFTGLWGNEN